MVKVVHAYWKILNNREVYLFKNETLPYMLSCTSLYSFSIKSWMSLLVSIPTLPILYFWFYSHRIFRVGMCLSLRAGFSSGMWEQGKPSLHRWPCRVGTQGKAASGWGPCGPGQCEGVKRQFSTEKGEVRLQKREIKWEAMMLRIEQRERRMTRA